MLENQLSKKRLRWQCRRGMLELDVLLGRFLEQQYDELNTQQRQEFVNLLTIDDTELYGWLVQQQTVKQEFAAIVALIRNGQETDDK